MGIKRSIIIDRTTGYRMTVNKRTADKLRGLSPNLIVYDEDPRDTLMRYEKENELITHFKRMKTFDKFIRNLRLETLHEKMKREAMMEPRLIVPKDHHIDAMRYGSSYNVIKHTGEAPKGVWV